MKRVVSLYIEVTTQRMQRYREGLEQAIKVAGTDWQAQLRSAANWLLSQPMMHLGRMLQSDVRAISETSAEKLRIVVFESLLKPLEAVFAEALAANPTRRGRSAMLAGMFLSLIEGIDNLPSNYVAGSKEELVDVVLDLLINGLNP